jgi:hypothetical protein
MAATPFAQIARQLAAQGNIKVSKSGMNLSGQNHPLARMPDPSWTTKYSPKLLMIIIFMPGFLHWNVASA